MDQLHAPNYQLKLNAKCFAPGRWRAAAQPGGWAAIRHIASYVLSTLLVMPSLAAGVPPQDKVVISEDPAVYVALGELVVTLERTPLKELIDTVDRTLKDSGEATRTQDVSRSPVCFTYGNVEVRFQSGIMAGRALEVTEFTIEAVTAPHTRCSSLPRAFQPARVGGWLEIGASREAVERRLGAASGRSESASYSFIGKVPGYCTVEGLDVGSHLAVTYVAGKVVRISGLRVTSC